MVEPFKSVQTAVIVLGIYLWFLLHEAVKSIAASSGWDASPPHSTPQHSVRLPQHLAGPHLYS